MATSQDDVDELTAAVEELEADASDPELAADPRFWARAGDLVLQARHLGAHASNVLLDQIEPLQARAEPFDLTPLFADEHERLFALEAAMAAGRDQVDRNSVEAFALSLEAALRHANAQAPSDDRAIEKLKFLARRARDLVFSR